MVWSLRRLIRQFAKYVIYSCGYSVLYEMTKASRNVDDILKWEVLNITTKMLTIFRPSAHFDLFWLLDP